jgi:hypothetical protein
MESHHNVSLLRRFSRLELNEKLRLSGVGRVEYLVLTNVSANIAVAIFKVDMISTSKMAIAMFAETLVNTKHSTHLSPESRSYTPHCTVCIVGLLSNSVQFPSGDKTIG